jgi:hypothetical protein
MNQPPDRFAHKRTVDSDELEVAANRQFDTVAHLFRRRSAQAIPRRPVSTRWTWLAELRSLPPVTLLFRKIDWQFSSALL